MIVTFDTKHVCNRWTMRGLHEAIEYISCRETVIKIDIQFSILTSQWIRLIQTRTMCWSSGTMQNRNRNSRSSLSLIQTIRCTSTSPSPPPVMLNATNYGEPALVAHHGAYHVSFLKSNLKNLNSKPPYNASPSPRPPHEPSSLFTSALRLNAFLSIWKDLQRLW